jgi:hypothetical protein
LDVGSMVINNYFIVRGLFVGLSRMKVLREKIIAWVGGWGFRVGVGFGEIWGLGLGVCCRGFMGWWVFGWGGWDLGEPIIGLD